MDYIHIGKPLKSKDISGSELAVVATTVIESVTFLSHFSYKKKDMGLHCYSGSKFAVPPYILYVLNIKMIYFTKNSAHVYAHLLLYILDKQILIS